MLNPSFIAKYENTIIKHIMYEFINPELNMFNCVS